MRAVNEPVKPLEIRFTAAVCLTHVWGGETFFVDAKQLADYNSDPDGFAARYFGFPTRDEYREWVATTGAPLCGARTKAGKPCRAMTGGFQLAPSRWLQRHRQLYCHSHGAARRPLMTF